MRMCMGSRRSFICRMSATVTTRISSSFRAQARLQRMYSELPIRVGTLCYLDWFERYAAVCSALSMMSSTKQHSFLGTLGPGYQKAQRAPLASLGGNVTD
ncbi:hypothetical protein U0070_021186 [Myodes glareolus]|uniref:Uncharacterized protein n=1 Tax=Myodes glareolus TaxID=447135 RepID=A0AAW0ILF3_MYOGA